MASMLYLDYNRKDGEWEPNVHGGNGNLEAMDFLKKINIAAFKRHPGVLMIAEESTAWPLVTAPVHDGGLGFNFKWNMGWMNDMLSYMSTDPLFRGSIHQQLTFSFFYAFSENFILPISHDEVVHGKCSLISKMPGFYHDKFAEMRVFLGYMITHPGKKLLFMGQEFGQFTEWSEAKELDWMLLDYETHSQLHAYTKALNHFYLKQSTLWELDNTWEGFQWIVPDDYMQNIIVFLRRDKQGEEMIVVCNFSPVQREQYRFGVPQSGSYRLLFSSDKAEFGGGDYSGATLRSRKGEMHGFEQSIGVTIPPLSITMYSVPKSSTSQADIQEASSK